MTTPSANEVCGRCWKSPMTYLSILVIVVGLFETFTTTAIGYYLVYRKNPYVGFCFALEHPGIRRTCLLDLTGGVMGILVGVIILMIEFFSAHLNKHDWKMVFSVINIILTFITAMVHLAGILHGAIAYNNYCDGHDSDDPYYVNAFDGDNKRCDFDRIFKNADAGFAFVVGFSGVGAMFWISMLGAETIRACILSCQYMQNTRVGLSVRANEYQPLPTEMNDMPPSPPNYSEM